VSVHTSWLPNKKVLVKGADRLVMASYKVDMVILPI
jgi:hypothetical protein